ncbi:MAG: FecR domain-containing protein [Anaerolineae bacterium]|nr:FecR domain-containing protein [Anaerolineae bacterium]
MKRLTRCIPLLIGFAVLLAPAVTALPVLAGYAPAPGPVAAQASGSLASLDPVQGLIQHQTAFENPQDPQSWHTVTQRILVGEGDRIRTDSVGLAYLTFFEGIQTQIGQSTLVVVSTLVLPEGDNGTVNVSMDVLVGNTFASVNAALNPGDRFEIHTPTASAVVRGTEWWTVVTPEGNATFAAERGLVNIIPHTSQIRPDTVQPPIAAAPPPPGEEAVTAAEETAPAAAVPLNERFATVYELSDGVSLFTNRSGTINRFGIDFEPPRRPRESALARPLCGNGVCNVRETITCPLDCPDSLTLEDCGDGVCDTEAREDLLICPQDCAPKTGESCGDGTCDLNESGITCPDDCEPAQYFSPAAPELCGNGLCDATESALTCPADCASLGAPVTGE